MDMVLIYVISFIAMGIFAVYMLLSNFKKIKILYFDSDRTCSLMSKDLKDDMIRIKDKAYKIGKVKPFMLKTPLGWQPMLILEHSNPSPKVLSFAGYEKAPVVTPEILEKIAEQNALKRLMTVSGMDNKQIMMYVIFGLILGVAVGVIFGGLGIF